MRTLNNKKIVVSFSGGLDSTVLLALCHQVGSQTVAISFNYGQKHQIELRYARSYANRLGIRHEIVDLSNLRPLLAGSALTDSQVDIPTVHYQNEGMKAVIVPNRNMIFLAVASAWAVSLGFEVVAFGAQSDDSLIFPDCRAPFVAAVNHCLQLGNDQPVKVVAPFTDIRKRAIVALGRELGVDFSTTWSCYNGDVVPCGSCGACLERQEALHED